MDWLDVVTPVLKSLHKKLSEINATVATAESCTGGLVAAMMTELPGSSQFFLGGVTAYANEVKTSLLHVSASLIAKQGAVSAAVAESMADGVRKQLRATYSVSLTGVAGPDGGTAEKPVGTVFCGIAGPNGTRSAHFRIKGDRTKIRQDASRLALEALLAEIDKQ